ncbi:MAG: YceI family protein, partial [Parvularculaceae bacterium]|nr:YceI family protein [Parvularculaceae bacterium]
GCWPKGPGRRSAPPAAGWRDAALPTPDWFDVKKFPSAKFVSTRIIPKGAGRFEAQGTLTIRDVSVPLTLPFALAMAGDKGTARGAVTLQRQKFGVGRGEFAKDTWVGFDVGVSFVVVATRPK